MSGLSVTTQVAGVPPYGQRVELISDACFREEATIDLRPPIVAIHGHADGIFERWVPQIDLRDDSARARLADPVMRRTSGLRGMMS